jgi:predicted nucleic acid-binding protein
MEQKYLIDSNVLIDYTACRLPQKSSDFVERIFNTEFLISVITKIEVLGFDDLPAKMQAIEEFVNTATLLSLDESVTKKAILLRREYKKLKLGDAIIAATAINYELVLITHNIADFNKIHNLRIIDPYKEVSSREGI